MKARPVVLYYLFLVMFCVTPLLSGCSYYSPYSGHIPSSAAKYFNLGYAYGEKGQFDLAIKEYQEAIRLKPDFAMAHGNLGCAYHKKGQYDLAMKECQEAVRLKPNYEDEEVHDILAAAYKGQGRYDLAIRHAEQALRIKPDLKETRELLDELYRLRGR